MRILNELAGELQRYSRIKTRNDSALAGFELGALPPEEVFYRVKELRNLKLEKWTKARVKDVSKNVREGVNKDPGEFIVNVTLAGAGLRALSATEREISKEIGKNTNVNWKVVLLGIMMLTVVGFIAVKQLQKRKLNA